MKTMPLFRNLPASLAAVFTAVGGVSAETEKILDFESDSHVDYFQREIVHAETGELPDSLDADYLADFPAEPLVEIERAPNPEGEGYALRATFAPAGGGYADYRLLFFNLARMDLADWRGWDALEFDVYNPADDPVALRAQAHGQGGGDPEKPGQRPLGKAIFKHTFQVPPGRSTLSVSLRAVDAERDRVSNFWVGLVRGDLDKPTTLFFDSIRKVRSVTGRAERLVRQLRALRRLGEDGSGSGGTAPAALLDEAEAVLEVASGDPSPGELDELAARLDTLEGRARERGLAFAGAKLDALAEGLVPILRERPDGHHLRPADGPTRDALRDRLAGLEQIGDVLRHRLATARLRVRMDEAFGGEGFAVGVPEYPTGWYARPKDYDGPLGTEVRLSAARREFEPFQLMILPFEGRSLKDVRIEASELRGPGGAIDAANIEIAPMGWQWMPDEERWLATMLRPDIGRFDVAGDIQQPVWVNVRVPEGTTPGEYRGSLSIKAEELRPREIEIALTVWPFTLPQTPSLKAFGSSSFAGEYVDDYVRFLTAHRWNPHRLYMGRGGPFPDPSYENFKRWREWGGTNFNLFWANHNYKERGRFVERDAEGRLTGASDWAKKRVFSALDPILNPIIEKDPGFLRHFTVYGFDEPVAGHLPVLEDLFGAVKERYGDALQTYFATHSPLWDEYGLIENIDIWAVTPDVLTPEAKDRLQRAGREIIIYNIYASHLDPVGSRVQFWSVFKDGLDGVLHYNPGTAAGEGTGRSAGPWTPSLFPDEKRSDGGLHRSFPGEKREGASAFGWRYGEGTMSTVAFEYWREGMEDVEYLYLLRELRDRLVEADTGEPAHRRLIEQADRIIEVPETVTAGAIGEGVEVEGEIVRSLSGTTDDMSLIRNVRRQAAALIMRIQEVLDDRND